LSFRVLLNPKAAQFLSKADPSLSRRLKDSLRELETAPQEKGERLRHSSFWRLRVGNYRVIYEVDEVNRRVIILFVGHRRDEYDDFSRLL